MRSALLHFGFEAVAYFVGVRLFLAARARSGHPLATRPDGLWVMVAAVLGAAVGSKVLYWLQFPAYTLGRPSAAALLGGKTIVGGLLGGYAGVEIAKAAIGLRESTGDLFVAPLVVAMAIGRLGCHLAGLADYTYGNPTALPWAMDLGDGVGRHPTALYEIAALGAIWLAAAGVGRVLEVSGARFRAFLVLYLAFRLAVDQLKPPHGGFPPALPEQPPAHLYAGLLTAIQLACVLGLAYTSRDLARMTRDRR